ncbi:MAG: DUF4956 domain-containing protein [Bacteroidota bacterium]
MTLNLLPILEIPQLFGIEIINTVDFFELVVRFVMNFIIVFILSYSFYYHATKRREYLFSYLLISAVVFMMCFLLENVKLQIGFALGLFAIFGIIRYRTNPIPIKEMTYLFLIIGISVINSLANKKVSYAELILTNFLLIAIVWYLERVWMINSEGHKTIIYEKINLITPDKRAELIQDLKERTGLEISRIEIGRIDFLRDTARIRVFFYNPENLSNSLSDDLDTGISDDDD